MNNYDTLQKVVVDRAGFGYPVLCNTLRRLTPYFRPTESCGVPAQLANPIWTRI